MNFPLIKRRPIREYRTIFGPKMSQHSSKLLSNVLIGTLPVGFPLSVTTISGTRGAKLMAKTMTFNAADPKNKPSAEFLKRRRNPRDRPLMFRDMQPWYQRKYANTPEDELPLGITSTGTRPIGYQNYFKEFIRVPEMIPEIVVPDLHGFELKAYVSYQAADVDMPEFTARDLYDTTHAVDLKKQFEAGKLNDEVASVVEKTKRGELKQATYDQRPKLMHDTADGPVG